MVYQNVLRIPKAFRSKSFLSPDELKQLEECGLQFFVRESKYHILNDYPCKGASENRLVSSKIKGPFETAPKLKIKKRDEQESEQELVKFLIPTRLMPAKFEPISLAEYETVTDCYAQDLLTSFSDERLDSDKVWKIGEEVLQRVIESNGKEANGFYRTINDNFMLEFELRRETRYEKYGAPKIRMAILGKDDEPARLIDKFGVKAIEKEFEKYCLFKEIGIKSSVRSGFAYNFSFNDSSIDKVVEEDNIII